MKIIGALPKGSVTKVFVGEYYGNLPRDQLGYRSVVVVQPGITKGDIEPRLAEVLAAANYHLVRAGHEELEVWGSA